MSIGTFMFCRELQIAGLTPSQSMKAAKPDDGEKQIERVRRICLALPETWEKISHGEPTWFVGKKVFAMFSNRCVRATPLGPDRLSDLEHR